MKHSCISLIVMHTIFSVSTGYGQDSRIDASQSIPEPLVSDVNGVNYGDSKSGGPVVTTTSGEFGEMPILYRRSNWEPFSVRLDLDVTYTGNATLAPGHEINDVFFREALTLSYTPQIKGSLFGDISVRQASHVYDEIGELDFDSIDLYAGGIYILPREMPVIGDASTFFRYRFNELYERAFSNSFYENQSIVIGVQKTWRPRRGHSFYLGYTSAFSVETDPEQFQRHEHSWFTGYKIKWTDQFGSSLNYRGSYYDYTNFGGRSDVNNILALDATYELTDWAALKAFASYTWNESDMDQFDYESGAIGAGITLQVRF
ncbi:MAG: hypothetical protein ACI9R3_005331 [Verrucomicrobiales bacterium]|jgi:hypothetical protein